MQEKTAKRLKIEFANAMPAPDSHPYLESKNISIQNINIKVDTFNNLLIPLRDINGKMQSLQRIMPNGSKMYGVIKTAQERQNNEEFLARKNGLFFTQRPLEEHSEFFVCEGFASAMSMSKILNKPSIAAMDCGNLLNVCDELISKYPHKHITICADNDMKKEAQGRRNAGMDSAKACQEKYPQIRIIYPQIKSSEIESVSDFNDLVNLRGIEAVRAEVKEQIDSLSMPKEIKQNPKTKGKDGFER
ncbi:toprim domain-containing protein [Helicobacter fennelliae]|uniref:DNA primase, putative n=2 Tax=Helicobacter TaxID=209 RepID=T1CYF7_9HELI|nr:toprim domain-containing protein [Helicobacter fennelliae]GAD17971.1 DNA primase, putative [Helicobacter fennelliae MRY12-0050]STP07614.1 DNA primase TraC [Helicobacter fennelliae]